MKKVLIAHQSTIPHYRVPFYNAVYRLRPDLWDFTVVYNVSDARQKFFIDVDHKSLPFKIEEIRSYHCRIGYKQLSLQSFLSQARNYDLIIAGTELNNLSYPLSYLWRFGGKSVAYLGHGRDSSIDTPIGLKRLMENLKLYLIRHSDGFFAYTPGIQDYMVNHGVDARKVFTLYNTIDITAQRSSFAGLAPLRHQLRVKFGLEGKRILLFVGRLNRRKRLDFLLEAFAFLQHKNPTYHLLLIGGGDVSFVQAFKERCGERSISYYGIVQDDDIGLFYTISDLYVFPGAVGLGPLQALCFDLTPVVIESPLHNPEYEYLNDTNSLILPAYTTPEQYALGIDSHLTGRSNWQELRSQAWPSIKHLTIENMAKNFVLGVNSILSNRA